MSRAWRSCCAGLLAYVTPKDLAASLCEERVQAWKLHRSLSDSDAAKLDCVVSAAVEELVEALEAPTVPFCTPTNKFGRPCEVRH